jgi:hypothetical protein
VSCTSDVWIRSYKYGSWGNELADGEKQAPNPVHPMMGWEMKLERLKDIC